MQRHTLGLFATSLIVPYVFLFLNSSFQVVFHDVDLATFGSPDLYLGVILLGSIATMFTFVPMLMLSVIVSTILYKLRLLSWQATALGGAGAGLLVAAYFFGFSLLEGNWSQVLVFPATGALCGWIYWRIAIGRTPDNSHAIEAA